LLTGHPPFQAASTMDTLLQVLEKEPVSPQQLNPAVDLDLQTITLKCLEKEPKRRYESAKELGEELQRFLNGEPIHARPVSGVERLRRWCKRKPVLAAFYATATVLVLILTIGAPMVAWDQSQMRKAADELAARNQELANSEEKRRIEAQRLAERNKMLADQELQARERAEKELARAEGLLYFMQIASAQREWSANNVQGARELLDACQSTRRHWEWYYLDKLCHLDLLNIPARGSVSSVSFSPDGQQLAVATAPTVIGWDGEVKIWDAKSGNEIVTLKGHEGKVHCVSFSPNGAHLATGGEDGYVRLWNAANGIQVAAFAFDEGSAQVRVPGTVAGRHSRGTVTSVAWRRDGTELASAHGSQVKIWNVTDGNEIRTIERRGIKNPLFGGSGIFASCVAYSSDGTQLVIGGRDTLTLWDAETGEWIRAMRGHTGVVYSVAFSRDGRHIASVARGDSTIMVWNGKTGQILGKFSGHNALITSVAFAPDGHAIVTSSTDKSLKIWDVRSGAEISTIRGHKGNVYCVQYSHDGTRLASGSDGNVKLWDPQQTQYAATIASLDKEIRRLDIGGNRKLAFPRPDDAVTVWDLIDERELFTLKDHAGQVSDVTFDTQGAKLAYTVSNRFKPHELRICDGDDGAVLMTITGEGDAKFGQIEFGTEGRFIYASSQGAIKVFDAETGEEKGTFEGHSARFTIDPTGYFLASGEKKTITVRSLETGEVVHTIQIPNGHVSAVAFSPDGKHLAVGTYATVYVQETKGKETERLRLRGHEHQVTAVAYLDEGRIVSAAEDGTIKIWDASSGQEVLTLRSPGILAPLYALAVSNDGRTIASTGSDKTVRLWNRSKSAP
jgi:WD40 repeat protein